MIQKMVLGDCLDVMRTMPDNNIDFVVTDPPYGLSFMGKNWDGKIPSTEYWKETLRICKPGSMVAAFGGSRTHHHLMVAIEKSGWEIRDVVMWIYGSGFPKSHNFGKKIGHAWSKYGTALKPAYEPIIIAMKPLDGTFAQNADKWGVGGINIDDSRISTNEKLSIGSGKVGYEGGYKNYIPYESLKGRWPANIIFDEEAAEQLDGMTGVLKSGSGDKHTKNKSENIYNDGLKPISGLREYKSNSGGASRFFYCAKASSSERNRGLEGMPLVRSGVERMNNSNGRKESLRDSERLILTKNTHPTIKPISLMKYIITLLAPPGNPLLLDPFAGSGSTLIAAKELGITAIGIEKEQEYYDIACQRIKNWPIPEKQYDLFEDIKNPTPFEAGHKRTRI